MDNDEPKKLKPVVFVRSSTDAHSQNTTQQVMLLRALQVTSDPKKLKEMIGVRTVAEVYRTLDKLAIRKEFHKALDRSGISFDFIVGGIKDIAMAAEKDSDRLKAFHILLQTLGMDKYEDSGSQGGGSWEDQLLQAIKAEEKQLPPGTSVTDVTDDYVVATPEVPEDVKKMREEEAEVTSTLYGDRGT